MKEWRRKLVEGLEDTIVPEALPVLHKLDRANPPSPGRTLGRAAALAEARGLENEDLSSQLERATKRALERAEDLLELDVSDETQEKYGDKLRSLNSTVKTVIQTQIRVDEHRLKQRKSSALDELLETIRGEEARTVSAPQPAE